VRLSSEFCHHNLCVATQQVFVVIYFIMAQSENFWIYPHFHSLSLESITSVLVTVVLKSGGVEGFV
jgi:hypothetical protein